MRYEFIDHHRHDYPVRLACAVLEVSPSGYYDWQERDVSSREQRRQELEAKIRVAFAESRATYGSPRLCRELVEQGTPVCRNTVAKHMRQAGLAGRKPRRFIPHTTDSLHEHPIAANELDRQFEPGENGVSAWVTDITYIPTKESWLYLAGVMDLKTRRIVGWAMADHMKSDLVIDALTMALQRRKPEAGLLHHSDRGVQYACGDYRALLKAHGVTCSMSRTGNCYDNAVMESFWATLKTELIYRKEYQTHAEARRDIFEYIEVFYNRKRRHSALGYQSPEAFEAGLN